MVTERNPHPSDGANSSTDTISKEVIALIADQLSRPATDIKVGDSFEKLGADSLDRVEIIMKLEEHFGVEINDEDAERAQTVGQVVDYICKLKS